MVARGDLGIELPIETGAGRAEAAARLAGQHSKPSITATQMLASMVRSPRPTRAEVTDVANAIFDGTDAVMLSEETAVGEHPVEAVRMMDRDRARDRARPALRRLAAQPHRRDRGDVADSVAQGAVGATYRLGLAALVVPTRSGRTARLVSAHRPRGAGAGALAARSRRCAGSTCCSASARAHTRTGRASTTCSTSAPLARAEGVAKSGDLIGDHGRPPGAGARHEPVRGAPGALAGWVRCTAWLEKRRLGKGRPQTRHSRSVVPIGVGVAHRFLLS